MSNMMERWLLEFLEAPENFWGKGHRQAVKFARARERLKKIVGSGDAFLKWIEECLSERARSDFPTLLIFNAGSSGSHWVQAMVGDAFGIPGGGEVYLPKCLRKRARKDFRIIDMVQLVQAGVSERALVLKPIVNTTHSTAMMKLLLSRRGVKSVFLFRDPVDIVLSRTFRKVDYRKQKAPDATDLEYLDFNIEFVRRILLTAMASEFDLCIRYEDLRKRPAAVLKEMSGLTEAMQKDDLIQRVADFYRAENLIERKNSGNLFKGVYHSPSRHVVEIARERMQDISYALGYF